MEPTMTTKEVAEFLKLHEFTVQQMAAEGRIPAFKVGGATSPWRFRRADIETFSQPSNCATAK